MKKLKFLSLLLFLFFSFSSSRAENLNVNLKDDFSYIDVIDHFKLKANVSSSTNRKLKYKWSISCDTISLGNTKGAETYFKLPRISHTASLKVRLEIRDGKSLRTVEKELPIPEMTDERFLGLGRKLVEQSINDKDYEWYYDQGESGTHKNNNCGPTSVTMAIKWADKSFDKTPEDARNINLKDGGEWHFTDIKHYLDQYSIKHDCLKVENINILKEQIALGHIAVVCLDVFHIRKEGQANINHRVNKFYETLNKGCGHFIVVKGYKVVDDVTYFQVYDPNSYGTTYSDGTLKGKDRYYRSEDLEIAITSWSNAIIAIQKDQE